MGAAAELLEDIDGHAFPLDIEGRTEYADMLISRVEWSQAWERARKAGGG
jgi:hypothetical protein